MDFNKYNKKLNAIQVALLGNDIHKAHTLLEQFIVDYAPDMDAAAVTLQQLEQAMDSLLDVCTPNKTTLSDQIDQVFADTWLLVDQIHWSVIEHKPMIFAVDDLEAELAPERIASCDDVRLGCVFNTIRTTYPVTKSLRSALHECILSDEVPMFKRATLLSAVTLNVLEWFDADLLECMYTYTLDDQPEQLRQQSWTALCLCGMVHDARIMHHPRLREEYLLLCEEEPEQLRQLQKYILPLREHGAFDRKLKQILGNMFTKALDRHKTENDEEEGNEFLPKEEMFDQEDKKDVKSLLDLLHSSLDAGYNGFKRMCQTPFFQLAGNEHHWLMPFTTEQEDIQRVLAKHPALATWANVIKVNLAQTNTDKYGMLLLMESMSEDAATSLLNNLGMMNIETEKLNELGSDMLMMIYIQDFFRFFTLSSVGKKMRNPFDLSPDLSSYRCFGTSLNSAENLREVGTFLAQSERWEEAIGLFYRLIGIEFTLQNVQAFIDSYCHSNNDKRWGKHYKEVIERAFLLYPDDPEIMAAVAEDRNTRDPRNEATFRALIKQEPENVHYLCYLGELLNNLGRYTEALEPLYKGYMFNEEYVRIIEELFKSHFLLGQFEKAATFRDKYMKRAHALTYIPIEDIDFNVILALLYIFEGKVNMAFNILEAIRQSNYLGEAYQALCLFEEVLVSRGIQHPAFALCKAQINKLHAQKSR